MPLNEQLQGISSVTADIISYTYTHTHTHTHTHSFCNFLVCGAKVYEPRHEKTRFFAYVERKTQISFAETVKLISTFVFATRIVLIAKISSLQPAFVTVQAYF